MAKRNRSQGWQHAKISGHEYEQTFAKESMLPSSEIYLAVMTMAELDGVKGSLTGAVVAGEWVSDVFGALTPAKSDATLEYSCGSRHRISIKKPSASGGQAHLTKLDRFLRVLEIKGIAIPSEVKWVFQAFTGETNGMPIAQFAAGVEINSPIIKKHGMKAELYQNRLYPSTIEAQFPARWQTFRVWFEKNLPEITRLCFSTGYCSEVANHADCLFWGKTKRFYDLKRLILNMRGQKIEPSRRGYYAGSTITLPWGFLQPHRPGKSEGPYQLQFHYSMDEIASLSA